MSLCLQCIALNEEEKLCFRDSERTKEYGWIGYLRGDFGRSGEEFHSTWFEGDNPELNNEQFKELFDSVINILRQDGDLFSDILFRRCVSVTAVSSVLRSVHQRDIDKKLFAGLDIELFIDMRIVILQRAFLDIRRFQNFLRRQPGNIVIKNLTLGF